MDSEIARLRRQLEETEKRENEARRRETEARRRETEAKRRQKEAEQKIEPNPLYGLLDGCHRLLSQAFQMETKATLTTQGDTTNPVNRLFPKQILPWEDFPQLQEKIWEKFDNEPVFTSQRLFASNNQLEYVCGTIKNKRIYSEASLRNFQRDTVDNFVESIIDALLQDQSLRTKFHLEGRIAFEDRANPEGPTETSLEEAEGQLDTNNPPRRSRRQTSRGRPRAANNTQGARSGRRRNRRADQFGVHVVAGERRIPAYAVEFKAPHKLTLAELTAGLHKIKPAQDVIDKDGDTFEFYATRLVTAVITQLFSYMIDSGVTDGYICTGEAFVFLHIPDDPTRVYYHLCVPNQDVLPDEECRLHRTAVGQVLAFTLNALATGPPPQEWHDTAQEQLSTWNVEYFDVLKDIPPSVRKDPPSSAYKPLSWKPVQRSPYNTRSRARCQPNRTTPEGSSGENSNSDDNVPSPSPATNTRSRISRGGRGRQGRGRPDREQKHSADSRDSTRTTRPYCTMECIRGLVSRGRLDPECPNYEEHGTGRHPLAPRVFIQRLHEQLLRDRTTGFEQLHICGRTGYLLKASLLSHGYTVVIKATTAQKQHNLQAERAVYSRLHSLQGSQIPVCVGHFEPRIAYWYHGELMTDMMILSWSGIRVQSIINQKNASFFENERSRLANVLRSHGVVNEDDEWRNILWDEKSGRVVMIDFEEVSWLRKRMLLESTTGNVGGRRLIHKKKPVCARHADNSSSSGLKYF